MSLIQNPTKALEQARWYLDNRTAERLPGGFSLAAGNLLRQTVEQVLFVLAFYGRVPQGRFIHKTGRLLTAHQMLDAISSHLPSRQPRYLEVARSRHPILRKLGRPRQTIRRWIRVLNEPSHFSNPTTSRQTDDVELRGIIHELSAIIDDGFYHLIIAAANEIRTKGKLRAVLSDRGQTCVAVESDVIVRPKHLVLRNGQLSLVAPAPRIRVAPSDEQVSLGRAGPVVRSNIRRGLRCKVVSSLLMADQ